jgi:hypothetical protein
MPKTARLNTTSRRAASPTRRPSRSKNSSQPSFTVSATEALFLHCVLRCQHDYGISPELDIRSIISLPQSIGIVVDYEYVKQSMFGRIRGDAFAATAEDRALSLDLTRMALGSARERLTEAGVIGACDPFIWWTGKPVDGVTHGVKA